MARKPDGPRRRARRHDPDWEPPIPGRRRVLKTWDEYMALAKPIVQFDLTEGRVSAGDASWYARPNDVADLAQKIVALLGDENQRIHMGAIGRHMTGDRT